METPKHIGIIIDGNRRWARYKGLEPFEGHKKGLALVKLVSSWCFEQGIRYVSIYAFSTENWNRTQKEVDYLMKEIFKENLFEKDLQYFKEKNIRLVLSGNKADLPEALQKTIDKAVSLTANNTGGIINFCLNYGGRTEIIQAIERLLKEYSTSIPITEEMLRNYLYHPEIPDPDLIIRTGGEQRLSNFLTWQSAYSELYFMNSYWPDFTKDDLDKVLQDYSTRERRFGV